MHMSYCESNQTRGSQGSQGLMDNDLDGHNAGAKRVLYNEKFWATKNYKEVLRDFRGVFTLYTP